MSPGSTALARLAERIASEGEPLALRDEWLAAGIGGAPGPGYPDDDPQLGELAASGPLTAADRDRYAFVVEAIREGFLCHYGEPRLLEAADPDVALLTGDLLYAIGLNELSGLGDLRSTGILSDLIRVAADLRAAGETDRAESLWPVQIVALSCGRPEHYDRRLAAVATGDPVALEELSAWAGKAAEEAGTGPGFRRATTPGRPSRNEHGPVEAG